MTIAPGTRLGPYEIVAPIGAGGMGEVWKARDTRLDRSVAVKILPADFAHNAQLRLRFEREAKTISQLDHPHICTLFDVGDDYLVMEFLEGESLADRLNRGPLPLNDVLRLGTQVAQALERAHRAGIVHRDLKPGNVMLTKSGAKLLDFGLAKTNSVLSPQSSVLETQHKPLTQEGTILGTYQYMSPEQIAGEEADARSDIFSFGALLYEMLTGQRAFEGKTKTSIIAAIVGGEPRSLSQLQPMTPPALEHVIAKCLAKEPDARWQSAADIAMELEWIARVPAVDARQEKRSIARFAIPAVLIVVAAAATSAALYFKRRLEAAEVPVRAELTMPPASPLSPVVGGAIALSPDGTRVAMIAGPRGTTAVFVRDITTGELKKFAGTDNAAFPFWSPDGKQIGFFADQKLKTITADGAAIQTLCDAHQGRGGAWSREGVIVFAPELAGPLVKVSETGGTPVAITTAPKGWTHRNPTLLPDGKTFLYIRHDTGARLAPATLYAGAIDRPLDVKVVENASNAAFANGKLFFVRSNNLVAQSFDPKTLKLSGTPVPIAEHIDYYNPRDLGDFSVAGDRVVFVESTANVPSQVAIFDRSGRVIDASGQPANYDVLDLSPDGTQVAVRIGAPFGQADVWLLELARGVLSRMSFTDSPDPSAVFSPDGKRLAITEARGDTKIAIRSLDGSNAESDIEVPGSMSLSSWSADGKYLVGAMQSPETAHDLVYIGVGEHQVVPIVSTPTEEFMPSLSPNGKWVAYVSLETGTPQIYVTAFPSGKGKWQASTNGGVAPRWSRDGKQLYFVTSNKLSVTNFADNGAPQFTPPQQLPVDVEPGGLIQSYALLPNGNIVTKKHVGEVPPRTVHLITNWTKLLPN